ncbi:MAG TPA: HAD-IB family phosphatase [Opitutaceae bacterium]|nr:HAD-IB family phosphatase [Opitutaceae bacterium]
MSQPAPSSRSQPTSPQPQRLLVSDFDGTMTRWDFYDLVRKQWPLPPDDDPWEQYVAGRLTHFAALAEIFARIRTDEATLLGLVDRMELDPCLPQAARTLREHGWTITVASAGCEWYLLRLLRQAGLALEVHANPGEFSPATGLRMHLPENSRFFSPSTGIDKLAVVKDARQRSAEVAFAGDGRPDLEPSLLVSPERRFARGWLAENLHRRRQAFHHFEDWAELAHLLLDPSSPC